MSDVNVKFDSIWKQTQALTDLLVRAVEELEPDKLVGDSKIVPALKIVESLCDELAALEFSLSKLSEKQIRWLPALVSLLKKEGELSWGATELLQLLVLEEKRVSTDAYVHADHTRWPGWPKNASGLGQLLVKHAPEIERRGISVKRVNDKLYGPRWCLRMRENQTETQEKE